MASDGLAAWDALGVVVAVLLQPAAASFHESAAASSRLGLLLARALARETGSTPPSWVQWQPGAAVLMKAVGELPQVLIQAYNGNWHRTPPWLSLSTLNGRQKNHNLAESAFSEMHSSS
jgi:hypothetical protein